jgi:hypothetical protein
MNEWTVHDVTPGLALRVVREMPALPATLDGKVERLWQAAQARSGGRLFNGRVFSADTITPALITGHWTEFRRIVAQMEDGSLHAALGVCPLSVGGAILSPAGVVFGRRPDGAVYQAGQWQLPPAGSVDSGAAREGGVVDPLYQLHEELREELGLGPETVHNPRPLCLVEHPGSHVLDLGIALETELDETAIRAAHAAHGNGEYAALAFVPAAGVAGFIAQHDGAIARQTFAFLARGGLFPEDSALRLGIATRP